MTATIRDLDAYQQITTPDGLKVEGCVRHGFHVIREQTVLASYYGWPEGDDVLAALRMYRANEEGREPTAEN